MAPREALLKGKTILVTRAQEQAKDLVNTIKMYGGQVLEFPVIEIVPPRNSGPLDHAIETCEQFDWILFTSSNGVRFFHQRMKELGKDLSVLQAKIAVVGPRTARVLQDLGREPDLVAADHKAEGLLAEMWQVLAGDEKVLLPHSNIARPLLATELANGGIEVSAVDAYETIAVSGMSDQVFEALQKKQIDVITFTSSSTVKNFCGLLPKEFPHLLQGVLIACIGPITAATAKTEELKVDIIAEEHTVERLVQEIVQYFQ